MQQFSLEQFSLQQFSLQQFSLQQQVENSRLRKTIWLLINTSWSISMDAGLVKQWDWCLHLLMSIMKMCVLQWKNGLIGNQVRVYAGIFQNVSYLPRSSKFALSRMNLKNHFASIWPLWSEQGFQIAQCPNPSVHWHIDRREIHQKPWLCYCNCQK